MKHFINETVLDKFFGAHIFYNLFSYPFGPLDHVSPMLIGLVFLGIFTLLLVVFLVLIVSRKIRHVKIYTKGVKILLILICVSLILFFIFEDISHIISSPQLGADC
jgi:formate-dependent nitrite reductase membrane component NrfD